MNVLQAAALGQLDWAEHGFGTRHDGAWTPASETAKLHQVHGNRVVAASRAGAHGDGDALVTATPGLWLEIRTADCVPILLADRKSRVVAAVHAGWRGTAAGIARVMLETLVRDWNCRLGDLGVAIGPSIGGCCFAVGDEVAAVFPGHITRREPQPYVDLAGANREQLLEAGLLPGQIELLGLCTVCDPGRFHSFRRDQGAGRMVAAIRIAD